MNTHRLIVLTGQEGAGKSTTARELLRYTPQAATLDAEDVADVNPWAMTPEYIELLWKNVAQVVENFWAAGYPNVIAGSFASNYQDYEQFRKRIRPDVDVYLVQLCASKPRRDDRRIHRRKPTSEEWRDQVDAADPEDDTFAKMQGEYRYLRIDNTDLTVEESIAVIQQAFPEIYAARP